MKLKFLNTLLLGAIVTVGTLANVANAGLISSWNLNGDYLDASGNGHNGTGFGSSLPNFVDDNSGSGNGLSASFNNSNYIALNQSFSGVESLPELTASAWFKTTATGDNFSNWALLDFDRSEFFNMFVTGDGKIGFSTRSGSGINDMFSSMSGLNDGNWHHVAVTYGATAGKNIYVDGNLDSSIASLGAIGTSVTRFGFIGDGSEAATFNAGRNKKYYDGLISEVKIWDNALNAEEVRTEVPEPSTLAIFALAMMGLASRSFKKKS
jgi:hypothetical protein